MKMLFRIIEASMGSLAANRWFWWFGFFFSGLAKVFVGKNTLGSVVGSFFLCNALRY